MRCSSKALGCQSSVCGLETGLHLAERVTSHESRVTCSISSQLVAQLKTAIVGDRITLTGDAQVAAQLIEAALRPARDAALRSRCVNNEKQIALDHIAKREDKRKAWEDVVWALINTREFLFRH